MSVKVAVRVRPFNSREKELGCKLCVDMAGSTTVLMSPNDEEKKRDFTFDYSFWSHDGFETDENGYYQAVSDKYADQQRVFDLVGKQVLDNAWEGYHCCLFAYGQTGSGKSYSMVGYGANKGIVPISMQEIFERTGKNTDPNISFEVTFSMLEIYNERVQDLLIPVKERPHEGLKVREHQKYGVYVDGLTKHPVDSYHSIEAKMEEGSKNRTIGSTMMNASSSRAHTIMCIEFKKIEIIDRKKTERFSVINLVDLAGSEKVAKSGATGDRLKEGCSINKSLSTLGLVISKLADKAMGKKNIVVPYRDSALTRILQNALGGNSKTLMICAISPATDNYDETLSTLRYADQAKKIKNHAVINESEQDKMIRELKEENEKLKAMLKDFKPENMGYKMIDEEMLKKYREMEEQLRANASFMSEYEKSFAEKLAEAKAHDHSQENQIDKTKPYLMNLNEDPLLSGKVLHSLNREKTLIGKRNGDPVPDIVLGGIGIKPNHAEILNKNDKIILIPKDLESGDQLFVNGNRVSEEKELFHNDRVVVGVGSVFVFKHPGKENISPNATLVKEEEIDWEYAQAELVATMDQEKKKKMKESEQLHEKEVKEKIRLIEEKYQREKHEKEASIIRQKHEYEKKIQELENTMRRETEQQMLEMERKEAEKEWRDQLSRYETDRLFKERERERMQKEVQEEATLKRFKEQEKIQIEHKLAKHLSQITEINLIAKELNRDINFSMKLIYNFVSGAELQLFGNEKTMKTKIQIEVNNKETKNQYFWSVSKFMNRYFIIKDLLEQFYEGIELPQKNTPEDPFWDPPEAHLIGQGFLCLESLGYLLDNPAELHLVGDKGTIGKLDVNIYPIDEYGEPLGDNLDFVEDPSELLNKRLDFALEITKGEFEENLCRDTYCQYSLLTEDNDTQNFQTVTIKGATTKPEYNYTYHHTYENITPKILNYILNHNLKIQLFGYDVVDEKTQLQKTVSKKAEIQEKENQPPIKNLGSNISKNEFEGVQILSEKQQTPSKLTRIAPGATVNTSQPISANYFNTFAVNPTLVKPQNQIQSKQTPDNARYKKKEHKDCNIF